MSALADYLNEEEQSAKLNWEQYQLIASGMEENFRREVSSARSRMAAAGLRQGTTQWDAALGEEYARYQQSIEGMERGATAELLDKYVEVKRDVYTKAGDPNYREVVAVIRGQPIYEPTYNQQLQTVRVPGTGQSVYNPDTKRYEYIPPEYTQEWVDVRGPDRFVGYEPDRELYGNPYADVVGADNWYAQQGNPELSTTEFLEQEFGRSDEVIEGSIGLLHGYSIPVQQKAGRRAAARQSLGTNPGANPWI